MFDIRCNQLQSYTLNEQRRGDQAITMSSVKLGEFSHFYRLEITVEGRKVELRMMIKRYMEVDFGASLIRAECRVEVIDMER
jgi:ABC-type microcin C transport system permease subunit YejB